MATVSATPPQSVTVKATFRCWKVGSPKLACTYFDEPESPLSFESCLVLIRVLHDARANGSQVICATHSPVLAAMPDAQILQLDEQGINEVEWEDLDAVAHWRGYLADPERYLGHVLASYGVR